MKLQANRIPEYYCKECYDYLNEKITCLNCGKELAGEDVAKHRSDMHSAQRIVIGLSGYYVSETD